MATLISTISPSEFQVVSNDNLGAVQVATFLSLILFGVSLSQGYTYFRRSGKDRTSLKLMVSLLLFLESLHSLTAAMAIYYDTVTRYKDAKANSYPFAASVVVEILITLIVQCFFSSRIYKLSQRLPVSIACLVFALLRFIGGVAVSVENFFDVPKGPVNGIGLGVRFDWLITSALTSGAVADIMIAICMTYYLRKLASPTNLSSTTTVLNRLIRFSLQTGLITSMTSVAVITCFQAMPNMIWFGLYILLAKLYSNSLFVSLNARPLEENEHKRGNLGPRSALEFTPGSEPISISFQASRAGDMKPLKLEEV